MNLKNTMNERLILYISSDSRSWKKIFWQKFEQNFVKDLYQKKVLEAINFRESLVYYHDDITVCKETSIAEKIKLFPKENIVLNKIFNYRKPNIWF